MQNNAIQPFFPCSCVLCRGFFVTFSKPGSGQCDFPLSGSLFWLFSQNMHKRPAKSWTKQAQKFLKAEAQYLCVGSETNPWRESTRTANHVPSDCKMVIDDIKLQNSANYGAIIHEIIECSDTFTLCSFVHKFRNSNYKAHNLVKHILHLGVGHHVWLGHPGVLLFFPVNIVTT
jgi:hypothetical protein